MPRAPRNLDPALVGSLNVGTVTGKGGYDGNEKCWFVVCVRD